MVEKTNTQTRKKKPNFIRQEAKKHKRLAQVWRKPKGRHSKLRLKRRGKAKMVSVGYRAPEEVRGLFKGNIQQVLVSKPEHLKFIKKGEVAVLKKTSNKNRLEILLEAKKLNIQVINFPHLDKKIAQIKESLSSKKIAKKLKVDKKAKKEEEEKKKSKMSQRQAAKEKNLTDKIDEKVSEKPADKKAKEEEPKSASKPKEEVKKEEPKSESPSKSKDLRGHAEQSSARKPKEVKETPKAEVKEVKETPKEEVKKEEPVEEKKEIKE
jgi:large subunit ribosomal protein L32e